ncbi:MAG: hypothetical protein GF320_20555, partial [Armatimonadia bacterium]|nr:hypothetical protein [Armatimonadia bacterium]
MLNRRKLKRSPGYILAATMIIMIFLVAAALPLLVMVGLENQQVTRYRNHTMARYRAEGAAMEAIQDVREWYDLAAERRDNVWELVGDEDPGLIIAEGEVSGLVGGSATYTAYITKTRTGGYEEFTNWVEAEAEANGRTVRLRIPTWNMKLGDYTLWAHGSDEIDYSDVNRGSRNGYITWTPGDYAIGHAYTADGMNIYGGNPSAIFFRRCESAGRIRNQQNGTFLMEGQPR